MLRKSLLYSWLSPAVQKASSISGLTTHTTALIVHVEESYKTVPVG